MPNELDLPPNLQFLLEKREPGDRRQSQRRNDPTTSDAVDDEVPRTPDEEHRRQGDRRVNTRRQSD